MMAYFVMLSRYIARANKRLYDAAAALPDADFRADRGAFFKSIRGTLDHLLVVIWMQRFTGEDAAPDRLDAILFNAFAPLREARKVEDRRVVAYVETLDEGKLDSVIKYRRVSTPDEIIQPLWPALIHWFNHQTRHRRQAHAILTGLVGCAPELDLLYIQRLAAAPSQQRRCARPADEVAINDAWRTPRSSRRLDGFVVPGISVAAPASRSMGIDRARAARRTARMPQPLRFLAQAFAAVASTDQQDRPPRP